MSIIAKLSLIDLMAFLCLAAVGALAWAAESGVLGDHKKAAGISMLGLVGVFIVVLATSKPEDSLLFGGMSASEEESKGGKSSEQGDIDLGKKKQGKAGGGGGKGGGGDGSLDADGGDGGKGNGNGNGDDGTAGSDTGDDKAGEQGGDGNDAVAGVNCADESDKAPKSKKKEREELSRPGLRTGSGLQDCPHCPRMTLVPPGCSEIGAPIKQDGFRQEEAPVTRIRIAAPFYIGRYEVTRGEYRAFVEATGYQPSQGCNGAKGWMADRNWLKPGFEQDNNHPVVCVTWADAQAYVDWLSETTRQTYRLPSEGEWEHAARGGSKSAYGFSDKLDSGDANFEKRLDGTTHVGQFTANAYGLLDTAGNAWEMVQDCWEAGHLGLPLDGSARSAAGCEERVMRGGGWFDGPRNLRSAARLPRKERVAGWGLGFRVLRTYTGPARSSAPTTPPSRATKRAEGTGAQTTERAASPAPTAAAVGAAAAAGAAPVAGPMIVGGARQAQRPPAAAKAVEATPVKGQRKANDGAAGKRRERDR